MQKYEYIKDLPSKAFRRLTGVSKSVFQDLLEIVKLAALKKTAKGSIDSNQNGSTKKLIGKGQAEAQA